MSASHHQLLYHVVFSTKNRKPYLAERIRNKTFAYMAGTVNSLSGTALEIGGWTDHSHMLVRIPAKTSVSDFVGRVKANTSKYLNTWSGLSSKFGWQDGFGAFSVSRWDADRVANYIRRQAEHHQREDFKTEYVRLLDEQGIEYDPIYLWQ
jgi:REP element-mobilizing transposase RayT